MIKKALAQLASCGLGPQGFMGRKRATQLQPHGMKRWLFRFCFAFLQHVTSSTKTSDDKQFMLQVQATVKILLQGGWEKVLCEISSQFVIKTFQSKFVHSAV